VTLHGPWGADAALVFVRINFDFPRNYPSDLTATPSFDVDKSPLISSANRTAMVEGVENILAERKRRCLEPCLSFLRFGSRDRGRPPNPGMESDSDEDLAAENVKKGNVARIMRHHKNLGEPRTSQGVFAPNGQFPFTSVQSPYLTFHRSAGLLLPCTPENSAQRALRSHEYSLRLCRRPA
jgi:WD repeat-containing protein 59